MVKIKIEVKLLGTDEGRDSVPLEVEPDSTIAHVKYLITEMIKVPANLQKLLFMGKMLSDDKTLEQVDVTEGSKLHLVVRQLAPGEVVELPSNPVTEILKRRLDGTPTFASVAGGGGGGGGTTGSVSGQEAAVRVWNSLNRIIERDVNRLSWDDIERLLSRHQNSTTTTPTTDGDRPSSSSGDQLGVGPTKITTQSSDHSSSSPSSAATSSKRTCSSPSPISSFGDPSREDLTTSETTGTQTGSGSGTGSETRSSALH